MSSKIYHSAIIVTGMSVTFHIPHKLVNTSNYFLISVELLLSETALLLTSLNTRFELAQQSKDTNHYKV